MTKLIEAIISYSSMVSTPPNQRKMPKVDRIYAKARDASVKKQGRA